MSDYFSQRDEKNIVRVREMLETMPRMATEFFVGIQMRTSPLTRLNYAYDLRIFFDYLVNKKFKTLKADELTVNDIEKLTALDIELFMEYLSNYTYNNKKYKCGEHAKERKLSTLRTFFNYFYKRDKLSHNVTTKVDMPKIHTGSIIRLETDEIVRLLNQIENGDGLSERQKVFNKITAIRDCAILTLFLGTGIRISECIGLNRSDIDFNTNAFNVTRKGGNKSLLYFSDEVAQSLKKYIDWIDNEIEQKTSLGKKILDKNPLFLSLQGNRITVRAVEMLVKKYSKIVTPLKKITPHKLRSTFGTALYNETQDIYIVADVLGHSDVNTTKKHYAAISDQIRRNAAKKVILRDNDD